MSKSKLITSGYIKSIVGASLFEDQAQKDITTDLLVNKSSITSAKIIANEDGIIGGLDFADEAFKQIDKKTKLKIMKTFNKYILQLGIVLFGFNLHAQQEAQFTQFNDNTLFINPAYAGSREMLNFTAMHREQWVGFDGAPLTIAPTGKPMLVVFLAHWCPHCNAEIPRARPAGRLGQVRRI